MNLDKQQKKLLMQIAKTIEKQERQITETEQLIVKVKALAEVL